MRHLNERQKKKMAMVSYELALSDFPASILIIGLGDDFG